MTNKEILKKHFGFDGFKDIQEDVINNLLSGKNTLCLMPTGGGKSIIYQVAGIQTGKTTIVVSPLLALMKQQHKRLEEQGLHTISYNSSLGDVKTQFNKLKKEFAQPQLPQFIFVSPEKILSDGYLEFLLKKLRTQIGLIVIDEVHCISQWGHTFRPAYKTIPFFIQNIYGIETPPPILCLTATLNLKDKEEICRDLDISDGNIFKSKLLIRDNLHLKILEQSEKNEQKKVQLLDIFNKHKNEKIIVYTHIKVREYGTRKMAKAIQKMGFNCHYFDADMHDNEKLNVLEKFETGEIKIVFATSAFGMGIDIPDIRVVVHYLVPESIEQYYQEVGRAGRDGKPAYGYLLYSETNFKVRFDIIKKSLLKPERIKEIYQTTINPTSQSSTILKKRKEKNKEDITKKIYSLSRTDIREDNSEMIIFLYLITVDAIQLRGKGILFFDCFENNDSSKQYALMKEACIQGIVNRIAKKMNKSNEEINHDIFVMFNQNEIKLIKTPVNVLNYSILQELSDKMVAEIYTTIKLKVENRLDNFKKLIECIKSDEPIRTITEHLGISM
jgi:ATP-dependent DNA helicase RecQ